VAFKTEEKTIENFTFQVHTMPYSVSNKVLYKAKDLLNLMVMNEGVPADISPLSAVAFIDSNEEALDFTENKLAEFTQVKSDGEWMDLAKQREIIFAGRMDLKFKWLEFALEVNFGSFLDGLRRATKIRLEEAVAAGPAQALKSRKK